jgi:hypothetical protein
LEQLWDLAGTFPYSKLKLCHSMMNAFEVPAATKDRIRGYISLMNFIDKGKLLLRQIMEVATSISLTLFFEDY